MLKLERLMQFDKKKKDKNSPFKGLNMCEIHFLHLHQFL